MRAYKDQPPAVGTLVLVVDDDEDVRTTMCQHLARGGYDVVEASSGKTALDALKRHRVSLVLLDIFMPDKDGLETLREMRAAMPDLKVIAMSGHDWYRGMDVLGWAQKLGAAGAIGKPFGSTKLLTALASILDDHTPCGG